METLTLPAWLEARQLLGEPSWQHETHNLLPSRNLKIGDGVNNSSSESRACVFGPGFTEEIDSLTKVEIRSIAYDGSRHAHRPSALRRSSLMKSMESLSSQVAKAGKALASVANSPAPKVDRGSDKLPMCKGK